MCYNSSDIWSWYLLKSWYWTSDYKNLEKKRVKKICDFFIVEIVSSVSARKLKGPSSARLGTFKARLGPEISSSGSSLLIGTSSSKFKDYSVSKIVRPFTIRMNCSRSRDLERFFSLEQFFLTVCYNNFRSKIPLLDTNSSHISHKIVPFYYYCFKSRNKML